jgi:4-hydroxybenzoate polyprenyltransferase
VKSTLLDRTSVSRVSKAFARLSCLIMGLAAVANTMLIARLAGAESATDLLVLVFVTAAFSYALDRAVDPPQRRALRGVVALFTLWLMAVAGAASRGHALGAAFTGVFPLAVVAYAVPWMPPWCGARRVKDVPGFKPVFVAIAWAQLATVVGLFAPRANLPVLRGVGSWLFAKVLVATAASDVKDLEADRAGGVGSWAAAFGVGRTIALLHVINATAAVCSAGAVAIGLVPARVLWLELVAAHFGLCLVALRRLPAKLVTYVLLDGTSPAVFFVAGVLATASHGA